MADFGDGWLDEEEFPRASWSDDAALSVRRWWRVTADVCGTVFDPSQLRRLGVATAAVVGIAAYEARLLSKRPHRSMFVRKYALAQVLPSVIWMTKPAELVARSAGRRAEDVLRKLGDDHASTVITNRVQNCQTLRWAALRRARFSPLPPRLMAGTRARRSIIAGFVFIDLILRFFDSTKAAADAFRARVLRGTEPLHGGVVERVPRLAGCDSDVTRVSMGRSGWHVLPVYERLEDKEALVAQVRVWAAGAVSALTRRR